MRRHVSLSLISCALFSSLLALPGASLGDVAEKAAPVKWIWGEASSTGEFKGQLLDDQVLRNFLTPDTSAVLPGKPTKVCELTRGGKQLNCRTPVVAPMAAPVAKTAEEPTKAVVATPQPFLKKVKDCSHAASEKSYSLSVGGGVRTSKLYSGATVARLLVTAPEGSLLGSARIGVGAKNDGLYLKASGQLGLIDYNQAAVPVGQEASSHMLPTTRYDLRIGAEKVISFKDMGPVAGLVTGAGLSGTNVQEIVPYSSYATVASQVVVSPYVSLGLLGHVGDAAWSPSMSFSAANWSSHQLRAATVGVTYQTEWTPTLSLVSGLSLSETSLVDSAKKATTNEKSILLSFGLTLPPHQLGGH